jgi:hypothetical protein
MTDQILDRDERDPYREPDPMPRGCRVVSLDDARALWAYRVLGALHRCEGMTRGEWLLSDAEAIKQARARFSGLPDVVRAKLGEYPC